LRQANGRAQAAQIFCGSCRLRILARFDVPGVAIEQ